ncbi:hypothetical protein Pint_07000 [Pistacia integerrima]|uniref:Uncharacterized protein n=1 Tax=Pistacia integerrima TaxID=434235 RepID=A0ACC0XX97_9ROSI|nr:hypothetical protein Pint_07000 [Pistacia integerrima]
MKVDLLWLHSIIYANVPDFVFLAHVVDVQSAMHVPFVLRTVSSTLHCPAEHSPFYSHLGQLLSCICFSCGHGPKLSWSPFTISEYFLPFAIEGINNLIEQAILRADRLGIKVISLAALNKMLEEAFLTGATSRLRGAIALYLCRRRVKSPELYRLKDFRKSKRKLLWIVKITLFK